LDSQTYNNPCIGNDSEFRYHFNSIFGVVFVEIVYMSRIYVSYRRTDTAAYAGRLFENLSRHFGPGFVFMDVQGGITRGQDFSQAIDTALNTCEVALVILGKHWATSAGPDGKLRLDDPNDWVRVETAAVLRRNILVIPVLVDGARLPEAASLPEELRPLCRRNQCELSDSRWSFDVGELIKDIEKQVRPPRRFKMPSFRDNTWYWSAGVVISLLMLSGIGLFVSNGAWFKPPRPWPVHSEPANLKSQDLTATDTPSYRIRTDYFAWLNPPNVEFSVFINDMQVGAYNSGGVIADITRFIKPGVNEVHIAWTADPNMDERYHATLLVEEKRGKEWSTVITREVNRGTKAGETTSHISQ
jgi:TIR domain